MTDNHPYDENEQIIERLDTLLEDHFDTIDTVEAISIDFPVKLGTSNVLPVDIVLPTYELNANPSVLLPDDHDIDTSADSLAENYFPDYLDAGFTAASVQELSRYADGHLFQLRLSYPSDDLEDAAETLNDTVDPDTFYRDRTN